MQLITQNKHRTGIMGDQKGVSLLRYTLLAAATLTLAPSGGTQDFGCRAGKESGTRCELEREIEERKHNVDNCLQ